MGVQELLLSLGLNLSHCRDLRGGAAATNPSQEQPLQGGKALEWTVSAGGDSPGLQGLTAKHQQGEAGERLEGELPGQGAPGTQRG